jgi:hypothetical protein
VVLELGEVKERVCDTSVAFGVFLQPLRPRRRPWGTGVRSRTGKCPGRTMAMGTLAMETLAMETMDMETTAMLTLDMQTLDMQTLDMQTLDMQTLDMQTLDMQTLDTATRVTATLFMETAAMAIMATTTAAVEMAGMTTSIGEGPWTSENPSSRMRTGCETTETTLGREDQ